MHHFTHYHLLAQAHLPHLLRPTNRTHDYSKATLVTASREVLSRFVALYTAGQSSCQGLGYLTFIAITLCVAHIDVRRHQEPTPVLGFLAHQRLGDRGMMEQAIDKIRDDTSTSANRVVEILDTLLNIEADSANGASYIESSRRGLRTHRRRTADQEPYLGLSKQTPHTEVLASD